MPFAKDGRHLLFPDSREDQCVGTGRFHDDDLCRKSLARWCDHKVLRTNPVDECLAVGRGNTERWEPSRRELDRGDTVALSHCP